MPTVSVIVLNYNGKDFLFKCLETIKSQTYSNIQTIVVDNNSTDGSDEVIKVYPQIVFIKNPDNYGYTKANNIGVSHANGDLLLLLNNDTELFPNTIEELVKSYKPHTLLAPTQIIKSRGEEQEVEGIGADIFGYPFAYSDKSKNKLFYVDGAALFISKKDYLELGGFDEELFIFQEDIDLSWRARLYGMSIATCPSAKLYHYSGASVSGGNAGSSQIYTTSYFRRFLNEKNVIRNILKNYSVLIVLILLPTLLFFHICEITILLLLGKIEAIKCYTKAYGWNIKNLSSTLKYRNLVQKHRKISDFQILKNMHLRYSKLSAFLRLKQIPRFK